MNYKGSLDLLKMRGARLVSIEIDGRPCNVVAVPVGYNDISVVAGQDGEPRSAYLNFRMWTVPEAFKKACRDRNAEVDGYEPPSHQMKVSYREEFQERAIASAEKRLRADKDYMKSKPSDEEIAKAARYAVLDAAGIGTITPLQPQPRAEYNAPAPTAQSAGYQSNEVDPADDLPF